MVATLFGRVLLYRAPLPTQPPAPGARQAVLGGEAASLDCALELPDRPSAAIGIVNAGSLVSQQGLPAESPRVSIRPGPSRTASRPIGRCCTAIRRPPTSAGGSSGPDPGASNTRPSPGFRAALVWMIHQPPALQLSSTPTSGPRFLLQRPCTRAWWSRPPNQPVESPREKLNSRERLCSPDWGALGSPSAKRSSPWR